MSFKSNDSQQITLNDALFGLTDREKRMLENHGLNHSQRKYFLRLTKAVLYVCTVIKHHVQTHLLMYVLELLFSKNF